MKSLCLNEISNKNLKIAKGYKKLHFVLRSECDWRRVDNLIEIIKKFGFKNEGTYRDNFNPLLKSHNSYRVINFSII